MGGASDGICTTPIEREIDALWELGGTDLLVTAGSPIRLRVNGRLRSLEGTPARTAAETDALIAEILGAELTHALDTRREVDFSFSWRGQARFRGNAFHQRGERALALRMIPFQIPSFAELRLPEAIERFANLPQGLVLVTGPTGSGKSTTLASVIDYINDHHERHILTIEDPIEYVHSHKWSAVNQREVGLDTDSFPNALRAALREDPDVIMVGEMRDLETIQFALTIAETGHLVFATLHTNDASSALDRICDVFPADRQDQIRVQLAASLEGVVSQRLLPRIGGGLVAAFEILMANNAIRNVVREGKTHHIRNIVMTNAREGMRTLEMSLSELVAEGLVTIEDARSRSMFPTEIREGADYAIWLQRQLEHVATG